MFNILIYQKNASQKDIEMLLDPSQKGSHGENNLGASQMAQQEEAFAAKSDYLFGTRGRLDELPQMVI